MDLYAAPASKPAFLWGDAIRFFADHLGAVAKALLPPTLTAYAIAIFIQNQAQALYRHIAPHNTSDFLLRSGAFAYARLMMPVTLLGLLKQWSIWVCYCFAAVGICRLAANAIGRKDPDGRVFSVIREHPARFLKSSTLFFGMLLIAFLVMFFLIIRITDIQLQAHLHVPGWEGPVVGFIGIALVSAVLVRWIFAVPLVTLLGVSFRKALTLSDRITDYRALALWALILESEVMGYCALQLPGWVLGYLNVESTMFSYYATLGTALLLAAMSQAPLMIAVGLVMARWEAGDISMPDRPTEATFEIA